MFDISSSKFLEQGLTFCKVYICTAPSVKGSLLTYALRAKQNLMKIHHLKSWLNGSLVSWNQTKPEISNCLISGYFLWLTFLLSSSERFHHIQPEIKISNSENRKCISIAIICWNLHHKLDFSFHLDSVEVFRTTSNMEVDGEALDWADIRWVNVLTLLSNSLLKVHEFEWLVQMSKKRSLGKLVIMPWPSVTLEITFPTPWSRGIHRKKDCEQRI